MQLRVHLHPPVQKTRKYVLFVCVRLGTQSYSRVVTEASATIAVSEWLLTKFASYFIVCAHNPFSHAGKKLASKRSKCPLCRANISEVLRYDTKTSFRNNDGQEVVVATQSAKLSEGVNVV